MTFELSKDLEKRMAGAIENLRRDFAGLRTDRANTALIDSIMVDAYGVSTPITQVATLTTPDARTIAVQVWDSKNVQAVEKVIRESSLGLNPMIDGGIVRIRLPEMNEERRKELIKVAGKHAEDARVAIRNVRREGMDSVKKAEKKSECSKDEAHKLSDTLQKKTDNYIKDVDKILEQRTKELTPR